MARHILVALAVLVASVAAEFECPEDNGFFAHDTSCDKYWHCEEGVASLKICGNGLAFDDTDAKNQRENCDYIYNVECGERSEREPDISTPHCPRLHGVFADPTKCDVFWSCWGGEASRYQCAPGLAYHPESRVCTWADQVESCKKEEVVAGGFQCPETPEIAQGAFSRHPHNDDCRLYYTCQQGVAREYGCPEGTVFQIHPEIENQGFCTDPADVPGCEDYYPPGVVQLSKANKVSLSLASNPGKKSKKNKVRTTTTTAAPEVFEDEEVFDDEVEEEPEQADAEE